MKALLLPLDNRPVTYQFPQMICNIAGVQPVVPPRHLMGSLEKPADPEELSQWVHQTLSASPHEAMVVALDTLLYGGLIPSRRSSATLKELQLRAKGIQKWRHIGGKTLTILAQSSIMRVPDNYDNTEEKEYWARWGRELFRLSELLHRVSTGSMDLMPKLKELEAQIDQDVRQDYLATRFRNFQVNRTLVEYVKTGAIDFLIFSQDDSGKYGLNVHEKEKLLAESKSHGIKNMAAYAGADEVVMTLLSRWLCKMRGRPARALVKYSPASGEQINSNYEGQTIGDTIAANMNAASVQQVAENEHADFLIVVHTSGSVQGDHIHLEGHPDVRKLDTAEAVEQTIAAIRACQIPVVLCDVAYSNGADPALIERLLAEPELLNKLWGYGGWNTTGNAVGSAIAQAMASWFGLYGSPPPKVEAARKQALFVRLADDWAYQTQVRPHLSDDLSERKLNEAMAPHLQNIAKALELNAGPYRVSLPWNRAFEVEIASAGAAAAI